MIEAPRHLIRKRAGRVRVLRLIVADGHCAPLRYTALLGAGLCRLCGCTDRHACPGGCAWVNAAHDVCSACVKRILTR